MTGGLEQLKCESLKKGRLDNRHLLLYKELRVKPEYLQMTLSPRLGVVEIITQWHFRNHLLVKRHINVIFFPGLSRTGMTSLTLCFPPLKSQMIVCPSSLRSCILGTNFSHIRNPW